MYCIIDLTNVTHYIWQIYNEERRSSLFCFFVEGGAADVVRPAAAAGDTHIVQPLAKIIIIPRKFQSSQIIKIPPPMAM